MKFLVLSALLASVYCEESCNLEQLNECPEFVVAATNGNKMQDMCRDIGKSMNCVQKFMDRCGHQFPENALDLMNAKKAIELVCGDCDVEGARTKLQNCEAEMVLGALTNLTFLLDSGEEDAQCSLVLKLTECFHRTMTEKCEHVIAERILDEILDASLEDITKSENCSSVFIDDHSRRKRSINLLYPLSTIIL